MSEDWLKNWYSENYAQSSVPKPKADIWSEIDSKLKDGNAYWYASNADALDLKPNPSTWDKIEADLNFIGAKRKSIRLFWLRTSVASLCFFLFPFMLGNNLYNFAISKRSIQISQSAVQQSNAAIGNDIPKVASHQLFNVNSGFERTQTPSLENNFALNTPHTPNRVGTHSNQLQAIQVPMETVASSPVERHFLLDSMEVLHVLPTSEILISHSTSLLKGQPRLAESMAPNWIFGAAFNLQRSSLLNATTIKGINGQSLITNQLGLSFSADLSLARQIGPHNYIQGTLTLNDSKKQKYLDFVGANYVQKQLNLTYHTVTLSYGTALFKHRLKGRFGLDLTSGIYVGYLAKRQEFWASEERMDLIQGFHNFDVGFDVSLNGIMKLNRQMDMTVGTYYTNGMINIFKGTEHIPSNFYKTVTSSFGLNVGLRMKL